METPENKPIDGTVVYYKRAMTRVGPYPAYRTEEGYESLMRIIILGHPPPYGLAIASEDVMP